MVAEQLLCHPLVILWENERATTHRLLRRSSCLINGYPINRSISINDCLMNNTKGAQLLYTGVAGMFSFLCH